ncbi:sarcospan [Amblyraja radiata]|uniref:sarcospan n=1 Tax=Amblyraja radiata TaxID=386614 RepID=UPI00140365AE|nr:sarcospan [Amblyraja radiata]
MGAEKPSGGEERGKDAEAARRQGGAAGDKGKAGRDSKYMEPDPHKCCGCRFPLLVALAQLLLAITITVLAFIMMTLSSSLLTRDTPYWVGIIMCVAALLGLYIFCVTYEIDEQTVRQFIVKLVYFLLCTLGLILSISAVAFAGNHLHQMTGFSCHMEPDHCACIQDPEDEIARTFLYRDVSNCEVVTSTVKLYLLLQVVLNLVLALVCLLGCYLMWKHRYQVFFAGLHFHPFKSPTQKPQKV